MEIGCFGAAHVLTCSISHRATGIINKSGGYITVLHWKSLTRSSVTYLESLASNHRLSPLLGFDSPKEAMLRFCRPAMTLDTGWDIKP